MKKLSSLMVLASAMFMPALALAAVQPVHPALPVARLAARRDEQRKRLHGGLIGLHGGYRRGPGWTWPKVRRMALKRRNQVRHRAVSRRAR